jgi:hypothetical protein
VPGGWGSPLSTTKLPSIHNTLPSSEVNVKVYVPVRRTSRHPERSAPKVPWLNGCQLKPVVVANEMSDARNVPNRLEYGAPSPGVDSEQGPPWHSVNTSTLIGSGQVRFLSLLGGLLPTKAREEYKIKKGN